MSASLSLHRESTDFLHPFMKTDSRVSAYYHGIRIFECSYGSDAGQSAPSLSTKGLSPVGDDKSSR